MKTHCESTTPIETVIVIQVTGKQKNSITDNSKLQGAVKEVLSAEKSGSALERIECKVIKRKMKVNIK